MFVRNETKVMDTLIDDCTQKKLQKVATFLYGFASQPEIRAAIQVCTLFYYYFFLA